VIKKPVAPSRQMTLNRSHLGALTRDQEEFTEAKIARLRPTHEEHAAEATG